jgi:hypothetical protein
LFVAIDGDEWVAMAAGRWFDRQQRIAQLWGMWVEPGLRRQGLGRRLVEGETRPLPRDESRVALFLAQPVV